MQPRPCPTYLPKTVRTSRWAIYGNRRYSWACQHQQGIKVLTSTLIPCWCWHAHEYLQGIKVLTSTIHKCSHFRRTTMQVQQLYIRKPGHPSMVKANGASRRSP